MFDELIRRWWIVAARGIVAVAFGIATFLAPEQTLVMLVSLFGVFALLSLLFGGLVAVQSDAAAHHLCGSSADTRSSLVRCCWPWC